MKSIRRSSRIVLTNEAMVLKQMRKDRGLSMKKAAILLGKSDSYIAHLETGRIDIPKGERLDQILAIYGGIKQKSFFDRVRSYAPRPNNKDMLKNLLERANESQIDKIRRYAEALLAGLI